LTLLRFVILLHSVVCGQSCLSPVPSFRLPRHSSQDFLPRRGLLCPSRPPLDVLAITSSPAVYDSLLHLTSPGSSVHSRPNQSGRLRRLRCDPPAARPSSVFILDLRRRPPDFPFLPSALIVSAAVAPDFPRFFALHRPVSPILRLHPLTSVLVLFL